MLEGWARDAAVEAIVSDDLDLKLTLASKLCARRGAIESGSDSGGPPPPMRPGRPGSFQVVPALSLPRRASLTTPRGRFLLMHAVAHIEVCAVELALLAIVDFPDQSAAYYRDMLSIAEEEVRHARMLSRRLEDLGGALGGEPVHLELFEIARRHEDFLERLAVVPRILEARGLDVSATLRAQLERAGDDASARCLEVVYRDEIGHCGIGSRWFRAEAHRRDLDPESAFCAIAAPYRNGRRAAVDRDGRRQAGFSEREIDFLIGEA